MTEPQKPMSIPELAEWLGASKSTVSQYVREGMGTEIGVKIGKAWRFYPREAWEWLRKRPTRQRREAAAGPIAPAILDSVGRETRLALSRALARSGVRSQVGRKRPKKGVLPMAETL